MCDDDINQAACARGFTLRELVQAVTDLVAATDTYLDDAITSIVEGHEIDSDQEAQLRAHFEEHSDSSVPVSTPTLTAIEHLVAALRAQGWDVGDVLIPEQCAEVWNPALQQWTHVTAQTNHGSTNTQGRWS